MNKDRIEFFTDGVFAIVLTLLIIDIKLPAGLEELTNSELWLQLSTLWPEIVSFAFTFLVVSVIWINHQFLFHVYAKAVDRQLNLLNMLFLLFVVFVPFSAHLAGAYPYSYVASVVYGVNILVINFLLRRMFNRVRRHPELHHEVPSRVEAQGNARLNLTAASYILGIASAFVFIPASVFFYIFPMLFNIIPGTLDLAERVFRFKLA
jgi:uncharacterized membrane protein